MWRSNYDLTPDEFSAEVERLWAAGPSVLSAVAARLRAHQVESEPYGEHALVPPNGLIPAHLLGNMWAQDWSNIFPLVAPANAVPSYAVSDLLKTHKVDAVAMAHYAERVFTSMGLTPLPATFWERSLFVKPRDRDVVCHASAWDVDNMNDVYGSRPVSSRPTKTFKTIHHEEGHYRLLLSRSTRTQLYRRSFRTARTTASMKRSATPSPSPSRRTI